MKSVPNNFSRIAGLALLIASILAIDVYSQDSNFFIFLAFGQSNMEGYPGQQQHQDSVNLPARFQLMPAVTWPDNSRTMGTWTAAMPPLCRNSTGLCPCDYFGRTLVDSLPSNIKIGIINVSVAGCAIEMFDKAKYASYVAGQATWMQDIATLYGGNPYARLVAMGKAAQKDGVIKGILLHQGESGAASGDNWASEVKIIYNNLIKDLSLDSNKTPLLAGGLPNDNNNTSLPWTLVNPTRIIKNAYIVSSKGCTINSTGIHFDAPGYRILGTRYADSMLVAFRKLGTGPTAVKPDQGNAARNGFMIGNIVEQKAGQASISFQIPNSAFVTIKAYNLSGKEVAELAGAEYAAGKHNIEFGRNAIPPGVFVLKMKSGILSATRTMVVAGQ